MEFNKKTTEAIHDVLALMNMTDREGEVIRVMGGEDTPLAVLELLRDAWRRGWQAGKDAVVEAHNKSIIN